MQPQQQLEDALVGVRADVAFAIVDGGVHLLCGPRAQAPVLIVEEDAAVLHRRLALHVCAGMDEDGCVVVRQEHRPTSPRRDAHLARESEESEGRAATVGAGDDERSFYAGDWVGDGCGEGRLPLAGYGGGVELVLGGEAVDLW